MDFLIHEPDQLAFPEIINEKNFSSITFKGTVKGDVMLGVYEKGLYVGESYCTFFLTVYNAGGSVRNVVPCIAIGPIADYLAENYKDSFPMIVAEATFKSSWAYGRYNNKVKIESIYEPPPKRKKLDLERIG